MPRLTNEPTIYTNGAMLLSASSPRLENLRERPLPTSLANPVRPTEDLRYSPTLAETRILVVEDERIVGLHLKQQLSRSGYNVVAVVSSGDAAIKAVTERRPDVVLMDIHIEGPLDGIETAMEISAEYHVPVIYLTAFAGEATLQRARETKPYGYLMKPFSERELHATIQMALVRSREDQEGRNREDRLLAALSLAGSAPAQ